MDPYKSTYQSDYTAPNPNEARGRAMSRVLDKFTYTTTYKQEFCVGHSLPRQPDAPLELNEECKAKYIPGIAVGSSPPQNPLWSCPCQAEGSMPPRGAKASGQPTNLDKKCTCFSCGKFCPPSKLKPPSQSPKYFEQKKLPPNQSKKIHQKNCLPEKKENQIVTAESEPKYVVQQEKPKPVCPRYKGLRPLPRGKYGGQYEGTLNMPRQLQGGNRNNGIPWMRQRGDERREPDVFRINRFPPRGDARAVIHNDGPVGPPPRNYPRRRFSAGQNDPRIPGPFWIRQRPDERREINALRRRRFDVPHEVGDIIHGGPHGLSDRRMSLPGRRRFGETNSGTRIPGPFWMRERPDERRDVEAPRRRRIQQRPSEVRDIVHGELDREQMRRSLDANARCRPRSSSRIPEPFWMKQRPDERREPEMDRRRRFPNEPPQVHDIIHGEEARVREFQEGRAAERPPPINLYELPPGPSHVDPFWLYHRPDERRNPDMDERRKFPRQRIEAAEIIHGEDFRDFYDPDRDLAGAVGPALQEVNYDDFNVGVGLDGDEANPFASRAQCKCPAPAPESGPDQWMFEQDWGDFQQRIPNIPPDIEEEIRRPPAARVSCPPEAEVSQFDQPNAFMRKLYEKYPYLYQVLKETPPEELASRVFKDRFMSTYQVDFLHLGVGKETIPEGGPEMEEIHVGPDGEPEPQAIPGCSYRQGQKGDFGRKKQDYEKKDKEEPEPAPVQQEDEAPVSEYMATVSRLGNEIIQDQLYKVSQITKNMKDEYKKM